MSLRTEAAKDSWGFVSKSQSKGAKLWKQNFKRSKIKKGSYWTILKRNTKHLESNFWWRKKAHEQSYPMHNDESYQSNAISLHYSRRPPIQPKWWWNNNLNGSGWYTISPLSKIFFNVKFFLMFYSVYCNIDFAFLCLVYVSFHRVHFWVGWNQQELHKSDSFVTRSSFLDS